jgi:hypothetical protein
VCVIRADRVDETYLPLISLPDPTATASAEESDGPKDGAVKAEYDLVPDRVKVTMLLEAAEDIRGLERDLREVEVLKGQGVDGAGHLEGISKTSIHISSTNS